jgi:hypothetical protein
MALRRRQRDDVAGLTVELLSFCLQYVGNSKASELYRLLKSS